MSTQPDPPEGTNARAATALSGRWVHAARAVWIAVVLPFVGLYIVGAWWVFASFPEPCPSYTDPEGFEHGICFFDETAGTGGARLLESHTGLPTSVQYGFQYVLTAVRVLGCLSLAAFIFWKKSDDWLALLVSATLVTLAGPELLYVLETPSFRFIYPIHPDLYGALNVSVFASLLLAFLLFPDGRFVPRWTRWVMAVGPLLFALAFALYTYLAFPFLDRLDIWNLAAIGNAYPYSVGAICLVIALGAQVYRYRRASDPVARQQVKFVLVSATVAVVWVASSTLLLSAASGYYEAYRAQPLWFVAYGLIHNSVTDMVILAVPLSIGFAILRYRLWDIDTIINRTLTYGALSALVIGLYLLLVGLSDALLRAGDNPVGSLIAAGIVAVLFAPLRDRLQRSVNRLMYGERDDPYAVLSRLGRSLETSIAPREALPTIVGTIAQALKLPYAAIEHKRGDGGFETVAKHGSLATDPVMVPLLHHGKEVGRLVAAPRAPGESFSPSEKKLLEDLAWQAGAAVHAVRLNEETLRLSADLQRSRERLVTAREEERRRLRRDLHDGVGPQLAALLLELETATELVSEDAEASALMAKLTQRTRDTVADVRRSVHALRPPALDELGLVGALREIAARYGGGGLAVSLDAPEHLPPLPAAVEVACYLIAQEAMTNVVRHAEASYCRVRILLAEKSEALLVEVEDDGKGVGEDCRTGVGMSSMQERAEELGGTLAIGPGQGGGTLVRALLPCEVAYAIDHRKE